MNNTDIGNIKDLHQQLMAEQKAMLEEFEEVKKTYKTKAEGMFKQLSKAVFEACPQIQTICWNQYIPSFNDGEPCKFTLYDVTFSNATVAQFEETGERFNEDAFYDHETLFADTALSPELFTKYRTEVERLQSTYRKKYVTSVTAEQNELMGSFASFVVSNKDLMEDLFGSNAEIVITRDGVTSDYYDCGY